MNRISRRLPRVFHWVYLFLMPTLVLAACSPAPVDETMPASISPAASATEAPTQVLASPTPTDLAGATSIGPSPTESLPAEIMETQDLPSQSACTPPTRPTPAMTEGPYYTPDTPERVSLIEPGTGGTVLIITGYVLTTDCQPVSGAFLDFWQAGGDGQYDNAGYRMRGHQLTGQDGRYSLETVVPGLYPGRTRHIHVKVQAPGQPVLTTQLFFPDELANQADSLFDPALILAIAETAGGLQATFDFILELES